MSDLQALLLVVVLIYLAESLFWLRRGSVALLSRLGRQFRVRHTPSALANSSGGLLLAPTLPPLGTVFQGHQWPLSLSPNGVLAWVTEDLGGSRGLVQQERYLAWDAVQTVRAEGKEVKLNDQVFCRVSSAPRARWVALEVLALAEAPAPRRKRLIRALLRRALSTEEVRSRLARYRKAQRPLRAACNVTFAYLFLFIPVVVGFLLVPLYWAWWLLGFVPLALVVDLLFYLTHRRLYPEERNDRLYHLALMAVSPPALIRSVDALAAPLMLGFHPLALARVLCSAPDFRRLCRRAMLDLATPKLPTCPLDDEEARRTEAWYRGELTRGVTTLIQGAGLCVEELTAPPEAEGDSRSYCPRCQAQYVKETGTCEDCGGVELRGWG